MLPHKENCGFVYAITSENHLKHVCFNANNVNVNSNMVLGCLFYNALSITMFV
jgi:hypothetical protein